VPRGCDHPRTRLIFGPERQTMGASVDPCIPIFSIRLRNLS